ncbi:25833_t:CDS:2, partial [Gigaspora margarita]
DDPSILAINRDIYNARRWLRQENLKGCTSIQTLIDKLRKNDFIYNYDCDNTDLPADERVFFHKDSLQPLLQNFHKVYQNWLEIQQKAVQETLNNLINTPTMVLQNPVVVSTRRHLFGSSNNRITNSTKRDPSRFEL